MYEPKFSYTDKLVSQLIKLEGIKTSLQDLDLSYTVRHKLTMKAKSFDMFHLAHMIGLDITLKDAEKLASGVRLDNFTANDPKVALIANFRNTLEFNRSNIADTYAEVDFTILLHLNKLILTSWRESWDARLRNVSDQLSESEDNWIALRDKEVNPSEIQNIMILLVEWYKNASPVITPVVRIGIILYRLFELAPFVSGNKYTILALTDYLLLKNNLSSKVYASFIRDFDMNEQKYLEAFDLSKKNFDLSYWLENFTSNLTKDVSEVRESITEHISEEEKAKKQPFLDLNKRQLKVLRYLQTVPIIKREDYCHMMEVSTMTAFRDLNDLVRKKLIKVDGQGRGTKYRLASM
jgi:Fic family protein